MGVRGLQSFMERDCPEGHKTVRIADVVAEFRARHPRDPLVIVVDGMSCMRKLYGDLCWIMGGEWREFVEELRQFVEKFKALGVELVFFFDGATMPVKRSTWVKRRLNSLETVKKVFHTIHLYRDAPDGLDLFQLPAGMGLLTRFALKFDCQCQVFTSFDECDEEVALYAKQKNCIAVLGQDSDYIINNTAPYLSIEKLNMDTMTTIHYDRRALANKLGLRVDQLPLFACLKGNDVIREEMVTDFHRRICGSQNPRYTAGLFKLIAQFIRSQPGTETEGGLRLMAKVVLGDPDKASLLQEGLRTYGVMSGNVDVRTAAPTTEPTDTENRRLYNLCREKARVCENGATFLSIMIHGEYDSSTTMEVNPGWRFTPSDLPASALLYRPIRQRSYSLLLPVKEVRSRDNFVKEWTLYPGNNLQQPDFVTPIAFTLSSGGSTSLGDLWLRGSNRSRWEAFLACAGVTIDYQTVSRLQPNYVLLACVINYLILNTNLKDWEVDALIAQAFVLNAVQLTFIRSLTIDGLDTRCVHLSTLFMRGVTNMIHAMSTCGQPLPLPNNLPWNYFDGKIFHHCYIRAKAGVSPLSGFGTILRINAVELKHLKSVVVSRTRLAQ